MSAGRPAPARCPRWSFPFAYGSAAVMSMRLNLSAMGRLSAPHLSLPEGGAELRRSGGNNALPQFEGKIEQDARNIHIFADKRNRPIDRRQRRCDVHCLVASDEFPER